jgi:hypothetical protein
MAVKSKKAGLPAFNEMVGKVTEAIGELVNVHSEEIAEAINESEKRQLTVNIGLDLDCSESAPKVEVKLRFTPSTVTDNRTIQMDDHDQGKLAIYTQDELANMKAKADREAEKAAKKAEKEAKKKAEIEAEENAGA